MKRLFRLLSICLLVAGLQAHASLPNIVIILADDYGYGSAGCYGADAKLVRTPNIDRLATEGRRFTDASTPSSVCSPTRYALLTGRYCWRTPLKFETLSTFAPLHIEPGRLTMASMLKAHGYQTAAIGKWHLGYGAADSDPKWRTDYTAELKPGPLELGFDYHFSVPQNHGDVTGVFVENHFVYGLRSGKIPAGMKLPGPAPDDDRFSTAYSSEAQQGRGKAPLIIDAPHRKDEQVMTALTDKTVQWIGQQKPDHPFFLYYTPVAVHEPVTPSKELQGSSAAGKFGDWVHELDRSVGSLLDALAKNGLADNTLVIFTSDNGGVLDLGNAKRSETQAVNAGLAVNGVWRSGKQHIYEGGFRVPFIARWPGKIPAGTVCDEMVNMVDLLATTAAIVGEKLPPATSAAEDSQNMLPALLGEKNAPLARQDMILNSNAGVFAIRKGPWKWIEGVPAEHLPPNLSKSHAKEFQRVLYNLHDDPSETRDVSAEHPEIVQELEALLRAQRDAGHTRELSSTVDASTMHHKVMCGYQGWFRCPADAADMGWVHYSRRGKEIAPDSLVFEMWPDVSELGKDERFAVPGFTHPDGSQAELFSSDNAKTVLRHFEWMRDYGIDGAWLQHFLADMPGSKQPNRYASRRRTLDHVLHAAEATGRTWAVSFDIAGTPADRIYDLLTTEWRRLVDEKITTNPRYLHEQGLPVVQIWGFYWHNEHNLMTAEVAEKLIAFFKQPGPYQAFLAGGGDWDWRRRPDPAWQTFYRKFGCYSPWNVGHAPKDKDGVKHAATWYWADDKHECEKVGMMWLPVVYAGFSWDNLQQLAPGTSNIARRGGQFLWEQFHELSKLGVDSVYVAMFDEIDEGTAIFKVNNTPPTQAHFINNDGLPSDWYLRLVGDGGRLLKQHQPVPTEIPIKP